MPRPKSKKELLELSDINYKKLIDLLNSFSKKELSQEFPKGTLNRNIRDVVTHLHHWHIFMLGWYKEGMKGNKPHMPAEGYTWKTMPDLNRKVWEDSQKTSLNKGLKLLDESHVSVRKLIKKHTDEDLFTKKKYDWTGSTSLAQYLISNTSSHYDWAFRIIKKGMR